MDLAQALSALGKSPEAVAATLGAGGYKGERKSACRCPIARYLQKVLDLKEKEVIVNMYNISTLKGESVTERAFIHEGAVSDFILFFDNGGFEQLHA